MASEPSRLLGQRADNVEESSDIDAEGEEDMDDGHVGMSTNGAEHDAEVEGSDEDAEGEEVEEEQDDATMVGAVKIAEDDPASEDGDEDAVVESSSDAGSSSESDGDTDGTSSESDAENEWEGESDSAEEVEAQVADPNRCVFCGQDEEHDPSEEFEEYLACAVCGDNAHRQCARNANSLVGEDEPTRWRCNACVDNGLEEETKHASDSALRRRSSAPKIARDLLPSSRGAIKPDSHSVFNTLILDDDPMDGSRSLRKRKASDEAEHVPRPSRKRRRPSDAASQSGADFEASLPSSPVAARIAASEDLGLDGASDGAGSQIARSTRPRRTRKMDKPLVHIVSSDIDSLILSFNIDSARVTDILSKKRRRPTSGRTRDRSRKIQAILPPEPEPSHYPAIQSNFSTAFYAFHDREQDESKLKPYGGILSEADADTTKTFPQNLERKRFEDARLKAEEDWKLKMAAASAAQEVTRPAKVSGPPSKIKCINFGGYEIDTWHAAPYPEEYSRNRVLYICEFCLKYMSSDYVAWRHKLKCPAKHPPGDEIYRDGKYSFFEVDGRKNPVYCQNLCLLAKLFLGSKTLYYDVEPFLFYVMTENDEFGCHFVGYFSKEKRPSSLNNVSCILVLPIHQRKGFGHMLIEFSYLLTRVEQKTGSPEKPLSDMGLVSYRGYWRLVLCYQLLNQRGSISISTLSERTGMTPDDIISALEGLRALVKDPVTKTYALRLDYAYYKQYVANYESKKYPQINPDALVWVPYVMGRGALRHYDDGPAIHAIAQREDGMEADTPEEGVQMALQNGAHDAAAAAAAGDSQDQDEALLTPRDEVQKQFVGMSLDSPSRTQPSTPRANGQPAAIPPTRFEVFPPIPGTTAARRRNNRPFGSRRRTGTPVRRSLTNGEAVGTRSVRRGRSMLAEAAVVVNGDDGDDEVNEGETGEVGEGEQVNGVVGDSEMRDAGDEAVVEGEQGGDDA